MYVAFPNKYESFDFEKYLKSGYGRAFTRKHLLTKVMRSMISAFYLQNGNKGIRE